MKDQELEKKLNQILDIVKSQDLNIKILSNKLNIVLEAQRQQIQQKNTTNQISIEAVTQNNRSIPIQPTNPVVAIPDGFSRTARAETYQPEVKKEPPKEAEVIVNVPKPKELPEFKDYENKIAIQQKVINGNKKSIFMANVTIYDPDSKIAYEGRTNATGKWSASLPPNNKYLVVIKKTDDITKRPIELKQDIFIDGKQSPLHLPDAILK